MDEKKTDQAIRLFEALDGVDPELLARSEKEKKIIPFQRYVRAAAMFLAVIAVGGLGIYTVRNVGQKAASESAMYSAQDNMSKMNVSENAGASSGKGVSDGNAAGSYAEQYADEAADWANAEAAYAQEKAAEAVESEMNGFREEGEAYPDAAATANDSRNANEADSAIAEKQALSWREYSWNRDLFKDATGTQGVSGKSEEDALLSALEGKRMEVQLDGGDAVLISDPYAAAQLYTLINILQLESCSAETAAQKKGSGESILLSIYATEDGAGTSLDEQNAGGAGTSSGAKNAGEAGEAFGAQNTGETGAGEASGVQNAGELETILLEGRVLTKNGTEIYLILDDYYDFDILKDTLEEMIGEQ